MAAAWMISYNEERPLDSLGQIPPAEFVKNVRADTDIEAYFRDTVAPAIPENFPPPQLPAEDPPLPSGEVDLVPSEGFDNVFPGIDDIPGNLPGEGA